MNISVLMIGVARPNSNVIIKNIKKNINYLTNKKSYNFTFYIFIYKNRYSDKIQEFCKLNNIFIVIMDHIDDYDKSNFYTEKVKNIHRLNVNTHRLLLSMKNALNYIDKKTDIVIRLRVDTRLSSFIIKEVAENTYYSSPWAGGITDNIGYSNYKTFVSSWSIDNIFVENNLKLNNESILQKWIKKNKINIKFFEYEYTLFQDNSEYFDGVPQWSKQNRVFKYPMH